MNADVPFVVLGEEWGHHASSTQHLARHLAKTQPLLYVNAVGMRRPRLNLRDMRRVWDKLLQWLLPKEIVSVDGLPNVHLYSPVRIPWNSFAFVRRWNKRTMVRGIRRQLKRHGLEAPVLIVSSPVGAEAAGAVGERLLVYYVTDDYPALPGVDRGYVEDMEQIMLSRADLIFATSAELQRQKRGKKSSTLLLPHGVDFEHFHSAAEPLGPVPEEMRNLPQPILGFYGLLSSWVDADLLVQVARAFPRACVVLIGPAWSNYQVPKGKPNLHWLGPRSYADLPRYAAHFDVGLITFKQNRLTASVNPLKLLEYLALGLPVVSTPLSDLGPLFDYVRQADNPRDFIHQVQLSLIENGPEQRENRFRVASGESWDARMNYLYQEMETALGRRMMKRTEGLQRNYALQ